MDLNASLYLFIIYLTYYTPLSLYIYIYIYIYISYLTYIPYVYIFYVGYTLYCVSIYLFPYTRQLDDIQSLRNQCPSTSTDKDVQLADLQRDQQSQLRDLDERHRRQLSDADSGGSPEDRAKLREVQADRVDLMRGSHEHEIRAFHRDYDQQRDSIGSGPAITGSENRPSGSRQVPASPSADQTSEASLPLVTLNESRDRLITEPAGGKAGRAVKGGARGASTGREEGEEDLGRKSKRQRNTSVSIFSICTLL